mmetsp:Transcript_1127/g.1130  ORF Transcript_1127/g.1130 Transcript_1127/m.1130 type:complete len:109 (-) Transcript_1127:76-402(-)
MHHRVLLGVSRHLVSALRVSCVHLPLFRGSSDRISDTSLGCELRRLFGEFRGPLGRLPFVNSWRLVLSVIRTPTVLPLISSICVSIEVFEPALLDFSFIFDSDRTADI